VTLDDEDRSLTFRRTDDTTGSLPGGFCEVGEHPAETAVRETREETGLVVEPVELQNVYWRPPGGHPHGFVGLTYRC
jgi:ADP-ribose pyrophosphatase YjhB (NUDIX family)